MIPRRALAVLILFVAMLTPVAAAGVKSLNAVKGAQVWFAEDHTVPMIALVASFPAGSAYDPSTKAGTASLAAALMDEGAGNLDSQAFQNALADHAIQLSAQADRDCMTITLYALSSDAKEAFRLLALALSRPRFDAGSVTRVRLQMLSSIDEESADPAAVAGKSFFSFYFGSHAYGHPVEGDTRPLASISAVELKSFAHSHWVRGGLKIALAGDLSASSATGLLRSTFGPLPADEPALPAAPLRVGAPGLHVLPMDEPQAVAVFGLPGLLRRDPDFLAATVANYILGGGGFASRLMQQIREKHGLTYDVSTELVPMSRAGLWLGQVATRREAMRETLALVRETLRKFATDGPTRQELDDAKTYLSGSFPLGFSSNAGIASQLNTFQQLGLPIDYLQKRNDLIDAVSLEDVRRAAGRLFDPSKMTIVVAGTLPAQRGQPADY